MSDVIDDPTVWCPQGQTIKKDSSDTRNGDEIVFAMGTQDMGALNRFINGARPLPTERDSYCTSLGILDQSKLTPKIWTEADAVIAEYTAIKSDCVDFMGTGDGQNKSRNLLDVKSGHRFKKGDDDSDFDKLCTWEKMSQVAGNILSYSSDAGGQFDGSYYAIMLQWCGEWWDAEGNSAKQNEIRQNIIYVTEDQLGSIEGIQLHLGKVKKGLVDFDTKCGTHQTNLEGHDKVMATLLTQELGDINKLQKEIDENTADIVSLNAEIDADRYQQRMTAAYIWIPIIGTIAGPVVFAEYEKKIKELQKKIGEMQDIIDSDTEDVLLHKLLQSNVTSMKEQAKSLKETIGPAMQTIEALEGSWDVMKDQLQGLHDNVAKQEVKVPKLALEQLQLNNIVGAWNDLHTYVTTYIENAQITPSTQQMSLDDYAQQLNDVQ